MQVINRRSPGKFRKVESLAAESSASGAAGIAPTKFDFNHPMPRLMDYFKGKSSVPEVDSAAEMGGKREED
jgi:hypothetical protein